MMKRYMVIVGILAAVLSGCRDRPVEPQPQDYDRLKDASEKVMETPADTGPATVTPRQAYEAFRDAIADANYKAVWSLLSKETQDDYDGQAAEFEMQLRNSAKTPEAAKLILDAMGLDDATVRASPTRVITGAKWMPIRMQLEAQSDPEAYKRIARSRFRREEIFDDRAKVYFAVDGKVQEPPLTLIRQGTVWRINLKQ